MQKVKKGTGNQDVNLPSADVSFKKKKTEGGLQHKNESKGGSRQGNAGHVPASASNTGNREPKL